MNPYRSIIIILCIAGGLWITACNSNSDQNNFERESLSAPKGYTHTDQSGKVDSSMVDPDDWRISPMFQGYVYVQTPAYPNPAKTGKISIEIMITGIQAVNGLYVYKRDVNGKYQLLTSQPQSPLPSGLSVLQFNASQFSDNGTYSGAVGLHRVFIYDDNFNIITYGDIKIE